MQVPTVSTVLACSKINSAIYIYVLFAVTLFGRLLICNRASWTGKHGDARWVIPLHFLLEMRNTHSFLPSFTIINA